MLMRNTKCKYKMVFLLQFKEINIGKITAYNSISAESLT
jgi:hypothetical protein